MLERIVDITNVGQFERFSSKEKFEKNNVIFGFNGAGKSTLSDIFYSLSKDNSDYILSRRRTLEREGEEDQKEISVSVIDEENTYIYNEKGWNGRPNNMYVFNEQFINDHVFVSKDIVGDDVSIGIGKNGSRLIRERLELQKYNLEIISKVNENIKKISDAGIKIKDFSTQKITNRTNEKKWENIAGFKLYAISEKAMVEEKIKKNNKYSVEMSEIEKCNNIYSRIKDVRCVSVSLLIKKIDKFPRITSKEIACFLEESLTTVDIKWAIEGYKNQKDKTVCPMCGQEIVNQRAKSLFNKLGKFISQDKGSSLYKYSEEIREISYRLKFLDLPQKFTDLLEIISILEKNKLLLQKDLNRLSKGLYWNDRNSEIILDIINKLDRKADNPYLNISLSKEEEKCIYLANEIIKIILKIGKILKNAEERLEKKIERNFSNELIGKNFELSYGINRSLAEENIKYASIYLKNIRKINKLNLEISDCYNQKRLDEINGILNELNTHIHIIVKNKQYFIKLKDFKPKAIEGQNETVFSEGENKAIAFAYFLSEIKSTENRDKNIIAIVDDPISSMDLNRKSIISYQIAELMKQDNIQIIVMTHDISFVERIECYMDSHTLCKKIELRAGKSDFVTLDIHEYLTDDEKVYKEFIDDATRSDEEIDKIIGLMSLRPYAYVKKISGNDYKEIENKSTYFAHTLYSMNKRKCFEFSEYDSSGLKDYINLVANKTATVIDAERFVGEYCFKGFDFDTIVNLFKNVQMNSMKNVRKKVMLLRPLIEACFFQFGVKGKFDHEHIGKMYKEITNDNKSNPERYKMCKILKELYDLSKKYHHGAEAGSLLGIAWVNPNEVEYYDALIIKIIDKIEELGLKRSLPMIA